MPDDQTAAPLRRLDLRESAAHGSDLRELMPRLGEDLPDVRGAVEAVIADVRSRGHLALAELADKFDGGAPPHVLVPAADREAALAGLDPRVRAALEESISRAREFAAAMTPGEASVEYPGGARVTARYTPVDRVGVYVPGGLAVYPSSVIMNVVPAQAAGVGSIALATPPQAEFGGLPHPTILAAAELLGVTEVLAVGGAQAVAALAYGVSAHEGQAAIAPVDVITGPGNVFVATAKGLVRGVVGIDAEAGPTEIAIVADETADARFVAADLVSQAEHDPRAGSVLITDSLALADDVEAALARAVEQTRHRARVGEALAGPQSGIILVRDVDHALEVADAYAAEHLEIHTRDAAAVAARVRHAGAVFVGPFSPVSLGDYAAGSNHVLPTSGTARRASGLNVLSFMKLVQVIEYPEAGLAAVAPHIRALADAEDLPAHGDAVDIRFRDEDAR
ncbi:histidinol dehydrogenase [Falsarthrobacter nasiphocae]|uniref:Histidinol dehydrogenase n=1 Tax=Falsarthrobacter nasiphocae TaxID=189863 RepID=A0AAE4C4F5_9MICC|nr:histidinol dehydrogenase [Falsarthrobacter nasiphocae]MDR6891306.1 histidinol dehydrogenase [Falsarthrobacter nasiphocae]